MAFFTACLKSVPDHRMNRASLPAVQAFPSAWCGAWRLLRAWLLALLMWPLLAWAAEIEVANPQLLPGDDGYVLTADFKFELNPRLEEAVTKGVVLHFVADFELSKGRWYWLDEKLITRTQTYRLSYHALTRQYRLSTGALHQSYASLDDVLRVLSRLRGWQVLEKNEFKIDQNYLAGVQMRLDLTQMPKTFQVNALSNKDWNLSSGWARWNFTPVETPAAPNNPDTLAPATPLSDENK